MSRYFLPIVLLLPLLGRAATPSSAPTVPPGNTDLAGSLGQMAFGLAIVVGVLLICLWLLKRVAAPRGSARGLRVLGAAPVGPRERVVLVEVGGKVLVLGVAPGRVNMLDTLQPDQLAALHASADTATPGGFAGRLKAMMEARKHA